MRELKKMQPQPYRIIPYTLWAGPPLAWRPLAVLSLFIPNTMFDKPVKLTEC